jgi:metallophosphoesterase (TIGR00282 family)
MLKVLMLGDIVGQLGVRSLFYHLPNLKQQYKIDLCFANGENADEGFGLSSALALDIFKAGVDVITNGNHIWEREEIIPLLDSNDRLLRPHNYPSPAPGKGYTVINYKNIKVAVLNLQGRVRMPNLIDCPFKSGKAQLKKLRQETPFIFVDLHAEDTTEREALALHFDGIATAVCGTHTHCQTADATILPQKTAHIGDLGMCGAADGVIGGKPEVSIKRSLSQVPYKLELCEGQAMLNGAIITADDTGRAVSIEVLHQLC